MTGPLIPLDADAGALAGELFDRLHALGFDGTGITRPSFSPGESAALDLIAAAAVAEGFATARDAAANLIVTLPGSDPSLPVVACGSHLDSVPQGGNFDGAAGVVAGLLALRALRERPGRRRSLRLFALRGEESAWFGRPYLGSSALLGGLTADDLAATRIGGSDTLGAAMAVVGADTARIGRGERLIDPATLAAWFELHIEQGPVLVARALPVAIVTGLRGNFRHRAVDCEGEAGHSGAVPRWLRHDAVFAVAELIARLDQHWQRMLALGEDLVMTVGMLGTDPAEHAVSRIPGHASFSFEARSESEATLAAVHALLQAECTALGEERGVRFRFDRRLDTAPARMDPGLVARLRAAAGALGLPTETLASGAGHDAAVFANAGVPSAMIFVRNAHGSHNPREAMAMEDFLAGTSVLCAALAEAVGA
jgi:beta-ureidopropionase / N-carbamoyl-L-amino-acid hydrolase